LSFPTFHLYPILTALALQAVHTTFIEYGFPQNSIGIYEIEYGILFTHFKLSIRFPPFPARIGNPVFSISIRSSNPFPKRKTSHMIS
jgi:hypothetical protein